MLHEFYNHCVKTDCEVSLSQIKDWFYSQGFGTSSEKKALILFNEISIYKFTRMSYGKFKTYFEPTEKIEITIRPKKVYRTNFSKIKFPKTHLSDGMVKRQNNEN